MRRYDLEFMPSLAGSDSEMVMRADGDWVLYVSHLAEVRQTQRRMIAALYWRAGDLYRQARRTPLGCTYRTSTLREACALETFAEAMEAACAR